MILFPTQNPPISDVFLLDGQIVLKPGNTVQLLGFRGWMCRFGSVLISTNSNKEAIDSDLLKKWVLFHSFLFNDGIIIRHYDHGSSHYDIKNTDENYADKTDYQNVLPHSYHIDVKNYETLPILAYDNLFTKFLELSHEDISRVKNCLITLGKDYFEKLNPVFDYGYWQIIPPYSVIEGLIGEPPNCVNKSDCVECKRSNLQHASFSRNSWIKQQLKILIPDQSAYTSYLDVIEVTRNKIRNNTVHNSLYPESKYEMYKDDYPTTHIYDSKRYLKEFKEDNYALSALSINIRNIARYLLMNKIFSLQVFPELEILKVFSMQSISNDF